HPGRALRQQGCLRSRAIDDTPCRPRGRAARAGTLLHHAQANVVGGLTETDMKSLKIVAFEAENFKRLSVVAIRPNGDIVQITGRNAQGKTSVLDGIWAALKGKAAIQSKPIRSGAKDARIMLDLGELIVKRTFKARDDGDYTTSVTVESRDGG